MAVVQSHNMYSTLFFARIAHVSAQVQSRTTLVLDAHSIRPRRSLTRLVLVFHSISPCIAFLLEHAQVFLQLVFAAFLARLALSGCQAPAFICPGPIEHLFAIYYILSLTSLI